MSNKERMLYAELEKHKFVMVRKDRHEVWENPQGLQVILSCSPSDQFWAAMALRDLRRKLAGHTVRGVRRT